MIRIGRRARVCRGCVCAAAGALGGVVVAVAAPPASARTLVAALALAALAAASASRRSTGTPRASKVLTRGVPFALVAWTTAAAVRSGGLPGVVVASIACALAGAGIAAYRRRGPDRAPCGGCPERTAPRVCSGYRAMTRRERAFARIASRWVLGAR